MSSSGVSLLQMPEDPMKHILEYLNFQSILVLRKVCHDLRNFIDVTKPASHLKKIEIRANSACIDLIFFQPLWICIEYVKKGKGCLVKWNKDYNRNDEKTLMKNEDFLTLFRKDFDIILRHQKTVLEEFTIDFNFSITRAKDRMLENLNKSLKSMKDLLQTKKLDMIINQDAVLSILPYMDPKPLDLIKITESSERDISVLNLDEIGQLEQWKQADKLKAERFLLLHPAQNLGHFSKINCFLKEILTEELISLKEMFVSSTTLNEMEICCFGKLSKTQTDAIREKLIESFGRHFLDIDEDIHWFFKIPDTTQLLRIKIKSKFITFTRIEQSDVPKNAVILN